MSGRTGEDLKISATRRNDKTCYSSTQLSRGYPRPFEHTGIEGTVRAPTLAVKLKRRGTDLRHISEIPGIESQESVKKLCSGNPTRLGDIVRRII